MVASPSGWELVTFWVTVMVFLPGLPSVTVSEVPAGIFGSNSTFTPNGNSDSTDFLISPVVLVPTRIFSVVGSLVRSVVTVGSPEGLPSTSFWVEVSTSVPSSPFWSTTFSPAGRLGSNSTSVSNGIGFSVLVTSSLGARPGPYSTIRLTGSLVVSSSTTSALSPLAVNLAV